MPTLDEILDGADGRPEWRAQGRDRVVVPLALVRQWTRSIGSMWRLFQLFEERLNEVNFLFAPVTTELLEGVLPAKMYSAWRAAKERGWVQGDIPPFRFVQNSLDPRQIGLVWDGEMTAVNFEYDRS